MQCSPAPARPSTHAFMLLPLPLSTMYGVFWAFCFSWSSATVPRGVSLELIFFRSCGARVKSAQGCRQNILQHPKCRGPTSGDPPPPHPASSSAAQSSSCLNPSRGSGGTAAGRPGDTKHTGASETPGQDTRDTHIHWELHNSNWEC